MVIVVSFSPKLLIFCDNSNKKHCKIGYLLYNLVKVLGSLLFKNGAKDTNYIDNTQKKRYNLEDLLTILEM